MHGFTVKPDLHAPPQNILQHLGFKSYLPNIQLRPWVQCYWAVYHPCLPQPGYSENLYPDGGTNINFHFRANQLPEVQFHAQQTFGTMHFTGTVDMLGVRFHPGGANALFRLDMPGIIGANYRAQDLDSSFYNAHFTQLTYQLADIHNLQQRIHLLEQWLLTQAHALSPQQGPIQHLLNNPNICTSNVEKLSEQTNISRRQIERHFKQQVGITLIQIKQLYQVKKARMLISQHPQASLAQVCQEAGFYDQSHFTRTFKKVTHQTPGYYRQKKLEQLPQ